MLTQFIRQQVKFGLIRMKKIDTKNNIANVLTKIICGQEFYTAYQQIMGLTEYAIVSEQLPVGSTDNDDSSMDSDTTIRTSNKS